MDPGRESTDDQTDGEADDQTGQVVDDVCALARPAQLRDDELDPLDDEWQGQRRGSRSITCGAVRVC